MMQHTTLFASAPSTTSTNTSSSSTNSNPNKLSLTRKRVSRSPFPSSARYRHLKGEASGSDNEVEMENYQGIIYFADVKIDSSTFVVQVDTGSSDLWISCAYLDLSSSSSASSCSTTCPSDSTVITYGSGDVCVVGYYANLQIGNVSVNDYVVEIAYGANVYPSSRSSLLSGDSEGLLGLAYSNLATIPTPSGQFIEHLSSFSIYLTPEDNSDGSFLLLNDVDDDLISSKNLTPYKISLKTATHWTIGMTAFQVGNDTAIVPCDSTSDDSCDAIVDTGTSLLAMPYNIYTSFVKNYLETKSECQYSSESGVYMCDSSVDLPRLGFTFGDYTFYLEKKDYIYEITGTSQVYVEIQATSTSSQSSLSNTWVIGETFLKNFYTNYIVNEAVVFYSVDGDASSGSVDAATPSTSSGTGLTDGDNQVNGNTTSSTSDSSNTTTILAVVLGVVGAAFIVACFMLFRRWRRDRRRRENLNNYAMQPGAYYPATLTPRNNGV